MVEQCPALKKRIKPVMSVKRLVCGVVLPVTVLLHRAEHIPDDGLLPREQFKGLPPPFPLGMFQGADGEIGHPHGDRHGGFCRILSGICAVEGSRGIHHTARHYRKDALRLLAAGAAGLHRTDLLPAASSDFPFFLGIST